MIACRPFSRIDRLWKAACAANSLSNPQFNSQNCFRARAIYVRKMSGEKEGPNAIYRDKKRKVVIPVWRPISTPSGTVSLSSSSVNYDNQFETTSTISLCEMENLSERHVHVAVSGSHHQTEVIEKHMHDDSCTNDAELARDVGKHSVSVEVGTSLIRFIIGKGGSTQNQIEGETGVKIILPSSKQDDHIVIEGNTEESVIKASEKIAKILEEAVKSPSLDYSHFISLPLAIYPELVDKLQNFQNAILGCYASRKDNVDNDSNEETSDVSDDEGKTIAGHGKERGRDLGIDKSIYIKPKTFHLTVLMLKLWNKDRVAAATEVLQKISSQVNNALGNQPLYIRLTGLECMRGSPAKAQVVYAPVEEIGGEGRLLSACQVIIKAYVEAGLVLEKDSRQSLKLHATLMNARHRKSKRRMRRHDFDARGIFLRYGSEKWGDYLIREAHLSQRFVFDENGYYHCCASIPFPESMQVE